MADGAAPRWAGAPPAGWELLYPLIAGVLTTGDAAALEDRPCVVEGPAGAEGRVFSASLLPLRAVGGEVGGVLGLLRDTTARVASERRERRHVAELVARDEAQTAFYADVGRAFVTPLSLLLGPLQALQMATGAGADPAGREMLTVAQHGYLRMLKLVHSFQQFVRAESGAITVKREATNLAQFTADLASLFRPACDSAGLRLSVDCPPFPGPVPIDRGMWERIVLNLLSNAVKYTRRGEIAVTLRLADGEAGERAILAVRDTGSGIAPRDVERLFERYQRVHSGGGRSREELGIGLSLVRELARLHDGTVAVESVVGRGSTFTVTIPAPVVRSPEGTVPRPERAYPQAATPYTGEVRRWLEAEDRLATREGRGGTPDEANARVLVVAADADLRAYLRLLLADRGVDEAVSAEGAVAAARATSPALVLADVTTDRAGGRWRSCGACALTR